MNLIVGLKPENLLMHGNDCKVADFSLARGTKGSQNRQDEMTTYVSTRWYRAPELLLGMNLYTEKIDVFAYGCVMAELLRLEALFPGTEPEMPEEEESSEEGEE